jgi:RNA polymerase sigma-70 factor (ECF subfamily)
VTCIGLIPAAAGPAVAFAQSPWPVAGHGGPIVPERAVDDIDRLYRLALSLCGSPELAEDLVQDAYVRVLARPRWVRRGSEFSYLARTVRNLFYDHHRQSRRVEWTDAPPEEEWASDGGGEDDPEATARTRELYALVAALPAEQRDVVAAVDVAGMSYREAAKSLRVPVGTVMSRLARGRGRLAKQLAPDRE